MRRSQMCVAPDRRPQYPPIAIPTGGVMSAAAAPKCKVIAVAPLSSWRAGRRAGYPGRRHCTTRANQQLQFADP